MKNLTEYINESLFGSIILWIFLTLLGIIAIGCVEGLIDTVRNNDIQTDPNLFMNMKKRGIIYGFVEWFFAYRDTRKDEGIVEKFYELCEQLSKNEDFISWKSQPISKRKLGDLKKICEKVFTKEEMKIGKEVVEKFWKQYKNKANDYTDISTIEKEIKDIC